MRSYLRHRGGVRRSAASVGPHPLVATAAPGTADGETTTAAPALRSRGLRLVRSRVSSAARQNQPATGGVGVTSVVGVVTALPAMIESGEEDSEQASEQANEQEPAKQTLGASTQTPSTLLRCTAEHELACSYIDKLVMSENEQDDPVPEDLLCPITRQAMRVPVVTSDGFSYELSAIRRWMEHNAQSPITREPLSRQRAFTRNRVLEQLTREWARSHAKTCLNESIMAALHIA